MNNATHTTTGRSAPYRGRSLELYHPNPRGNGSALRLEPRVNGTDEERYNCFFLEFATQKSVADRSNGLAHATFDWANKITVKLGFLDVSELLLVLEGHVQQLGGQGKGLYHSNGTGNTLITLNCDTERDSYYLAVSRKRATDTTPQRIGIGLTKAEAVGLRCLLQGGLFGVMFPQALRARQPQVPARE